MHPMSWLQFVAINLAYLLATPVATHIFLPVFYRLRAVSVYQWVMMVMVMKVMIIIIHPLYIQLFPFQLLGVEVWSSRSPSCFHGFLTSDGSLYGWVVPTEYQWPPSIQIVKDNMRKHPHYHTQPSLTYIRNCDPQHQYWIHHNVTGISITIISITNVTTLTITKTLMSGIVLYAPALALSAVTGLHFEGAVIGIGDHEMQPRMKIEESESSPDQG